MAPRCCARIKTEMGLLSRIADSTLGAAVPDRAALHFRQCDTYRCYAGKCEFHRQSTTMRRKLHSVFSNGSESTENNRIARVHLDLFQLAGRINVSPESFTNLSN